VGNLYQTHGTGALGPIKRDVCWRFFAAPEHDGAYCELSTNVRNANARMMPEIATLRNVSTTLRHMTAEFSEFFLVSGMVC
jgi:hypothetical protein